MTTKRDSLRERARQSIDPDAPMTPAGGLPAPAVTVQAEPEPEPQQESTLNKDAVVTPLPTRRSSERSSVRGEEGKLETALDDPAITPGRSNYRSFYIEDALFARFRAAVYWSSRREEAGGDVPENMSVAVSEYMERTASDLEQRFNGGQVFRSTPEQRKRRKKGK
jgi:hypothetical protein